MERTLQSAYLDGPAGLNQKRSFLGIPEIWLRFLLAIVGLGLAFAAALFSTVSRETGNLWATLIFASFALLVSTSVGLTTVPYLARRVAAGRVRDAFDYDVTRTGMAYFLAALVIGIAALNTGNNLLYIVVACMLAAVLISGIVSALALSDLDLNVQLPPHIFAGESTTGRIILKTKNRYVPSLSVSVVPGAKEKSGKHWRWMRSTFGFPARRSPEKQWFSLRDWKLARISVDQSSANILKNPVYFPYLPPGRSQSADLEFNFPRRGRFEQNGFGISTRFPFGFLTKTRRASAANEIIVFPAVRTAHLAEILPRISGEFESFLRGRGVELHSIRPWVPEDSSRFVDWKATAKSGSLKVREFTREDDRRIRIIFDNPGQGALSESAYESMIETAASLSWHFAQTNAELLFTAQDYSGNNNVFAFLRYLALVAPQPLSGEPKSVQPASVASILSSISPLSCFNIIVTAKPRIEISSDLLESSSVINFK
jgi:uncharacterized protein (DUF58 family)